MSSRYQVQHYQAQLEAVIYVSVETESSIHLLLVV